MDAITYFQIQLAALRRQASNTLAEITDEQLNWPPPGAANKIGVTLLHAISGEDLFIQQLIQARPLVWETQDFSKKIGIPYPPGGPRGWDEARQADLKLAAVMQYQEAVCQATEAYLAGLTPEELDRKVPFFGGPEQPLALLLAGLVCHTSEHLGEIGALKGVNNVTQV